MTSRTSTMSAFRSLSAAMLKGFARDRAAVFFALVFPLMFLFLFGGVFADQGRSRSEVVLVGDVPVLTHLPAEAKRAFDEIFTTSTTTDLDSALRKVRDGDVDAAVLMDGKTLVVRYSDADRVQSAQTRGALQAFVDQSNLGPEPPTTLFRAERVEDKALKTIQFVTPGLLGWAVAMSAAFGAAATLQGWRQSKLLRRLQLAPVRVRTIVAARIGVTVLIALVQFTVFVGLATALFGLRLTGYWWMALPLLVSGTLAFMSVGLLAGAVARTAEGAVNMANFIVLPMAFLSGSFFPLEGAATWLQTLSQLLPLRHLNDGMLDVMVRGQGPAAVLEPGGILLAFAIVLTALAARLFRWESS